MFSEAQLNTVSFQHEHDAPGATVIRIDPVAPDQWIELYRLLAGDAVWHHLAPLRRILAIACQHGCRTVVVEHRYVDLDFRSEYATFWSERFGDHRPLTRRVHFFAQQLSITDLHELPSEACGENYLGYMVLRPTRMGPVGRTVLRAPATLDAAVHAGRAVLTRIVDKPSLFGNDLEVVGVPYIQQDGELLRCAHAAAWVCQYVAWRNGVIGRRYTGELARMASVEGSPHRPLPSMGLTQEQMQGIFTEMGIPAIFYNLDDLPELTSPLKPPDLDGLDKEQHAEVLQEHVDHTTRERFLRVVCKYLNSGLPVIVMSEDPAFHAFTLVGWRHGDGGSVELIACDDLVGPYEIIKNPLVVAEGNIPERELGTSDLPLLSVLENEGGPQQPAQDNEESIDKDRDRDPAENEDRPSNGIEVWSHVMLPMPAKVYLSGDGAELDAISRVTAGTYLAMTDLSDRLQRDFAALAPELTWLDGNFSIRSRLLEGRKLKAAIDEDRQEAVRRLYRMAHLPQYVWLVELHDRTLRRLNNHQEDKFVVAEFVYDSTSHEELPSVCLASTVSVSQDMAEIGTGVPRERWEAASDGNPWRSLITGRASRGTSDP